MLNVKNWSTDWGGRKLTIEVGKLALQAHGSCTVRYGDTLILGTVVRSNNVRPDIDYFPLMVDFEEKLYGPARSKDPASSRGRDVPATRQFSPAA